MKKIILSAFLALTALFVGCDFINKTINNVKAEDYAKSAGKAIATIVVKSDKYFTAESKTEFAGTLSEILSKMPKDISSTNLQAFVATTVDAKLATTIKDEAKRNVVSASLKVVYQVFGSALQVIEEKYASEFKNADNAYALVVAFFTSINTVFDEKLTSGPDIPEYEAIYKEMLKVVESQK